MSTTTAPAATPEPLSKKDKFKNWAATSRWSAVAKMLFSTLFTGFAAWALYALGYNAVFGSPSWSLFFAAVLVAMAWALWRSRHRISAVITAIIATVIIAAMFGWHISLPDFGGGVVAWAIAAVIFAGGLTAIGLLGFFGYKKIKSI